MFRRHIPFTLTLVTGAAFFLACRPGPSTAQPPFDRGLTDADRKELSERFQRELWPLLERGGKDSCVNCHNGKIVSALRFTGNADKDFRMMLRDGFLLRDDAGSLLGRLLDKDRKRVMPPPKRGPTWSPEEIRKLTDLVNEIDRRQKS